MCIVLNVCWWEACSYLEDDVGVLMVAPLWLGASVCSLSVSLVCLRCGDCAVSVKLVRWAIGAEYLKAIKYRIDDTITVKRS